MQKAQEHSSSKRSEGQVSVRKREKPSGQPSKRKNRKEGIMEPKGGEWVQKLSSSWELGPEKGENVLAGHGPVQGRRQPGSIPGA